MNKQTGWLRLVGPCLLGAILLEAIVVASTGISRSFTARQIPNHLAAVVIGAVGGWVFELFRELNGRTRALIEGIDALLGRVGALMQGFDYHDQAISMLTKCRRHNAVLTMLIKASMRDNFRSIPLVGVGDYLAYLRTAIEHASSYQGVQRRSVRWYRDSKADGYLKDLRERKMETKTRIMILDATETAMMYEDLANQDVLDYYWKSTGDVETYWISEGDFRRSCPRFQIPEDFALYDGQLLISYNEDRQILSFDVIDGNREEARLFRIHEELLRHGSAFQVVPKVAIQTRRDPKSTVSDHAIPAQDHSSNEVAPEPVADRNTQDIQPTINE